MSAELHEMHALLQQLRDLNDSHDLDHCEGIVGNAWAAVRSGGAKIGKAAAAGAASAKAYSEGGSKGLATHTLKVATQQERDATVLATWGTITDPVQQRIILKSAIDLADPSVVGPLFLANPATKDHFQTSVEKYTAPVVA
jgi:hypothetical protein